MTANWFPYLLFPAHMVQGSVRTHTRESGGEGRRTCRSLWVNCVFMRIDFWKCSWAHAVISSRESWVLIQLVDDIDLCCRCWNLQKKSCSFTSRNIFRKFCAIKSKRVDIICSILKYHAFIRCVALVGIVFASFFFVLSTFSTVSQFILEWWLLHVFAELLCKHIAIKIKISCRVECLFHVALIMHCATFLLL